MIDVSVVGSLHLDIMVAAPRLPGRDETLIGTSWHYKCGGKGGNQAVAAARFGAKTAFGGQTGQDDFGERLRANLGASGLEPERHRPAPWLAPGGQMVTRVTYAFQAGKNFKQARFVWRTMAKVACDRRAQGFGVVMQQRFERVQTPPPFWQRCQKVGPAGLMNAGERSL